MKRIPLELTVEEDDYDDETHVISYLVRLNGIAVHKQSVKIVDPHDPDNWTAAEEAAVESYIQALRTTS